MVRLITIRFSHFCEKARWALDHAGIDYQERAHLPMFSWLAALTAAGSRTVPALVAGDRLSDSTDILRWVDRQKLAPPLYPVEEVAALEDDFDCNLGPATRRVAYHFFFRHPQLFTEMLEHSGAPSWQIRSVRLMQPLMTAGIRRKFDVDHLAGALAIVDRSFAEIATRLGDRPYLVGDDFTAADLTFAALSVGVTAPPEFERFVLPPSRMPDDYRRLVERYRDTPAGRFALRIYRQHRLKSERVVKPPSPSRSVA